MLQRYPTIRKMAPEFLSTFVFRGHAVAANLLRSLSMVADLYRKGKERYPTGLPYLRLNQQAVIFAKRVFGRLREECAFTGGHTIIKDYMREREQRRQEVFVLLVAPARPRIKSTAA